MGFYTWSARVLSARFSSINYITEAGVWENHRANLTKVPRSSFVESHSCHYILSIKSFFITMYSSVLGLTPGFVKRLWAGL